ncbi:MAG: hypothetical protein ACQEVA_10550 [Myxococcota bacterium]
MLPEEPLQLSLLAADEEVPQANSVAKLVTLMVAIGREAREEDALATIMDVEVRTVQYYVDLARWLGFVRRDAQGPALTEIGFSFYESVPARGRLFSNAVFKREIVKLANEIKRTADEAGNELTTTEACRRAIERTTELSESTARRRASSLARLVEVAYQPSHVDWQTGESLEAYKHAPLEFEGESFLTAMAAMELGMRRRIEIGFPRQVWQFVCGDRSGIDADRWRRASYQLEPEGRWFGSIPVNDVTLKRGERGGRGLRELLLVCAPVITLMTVLLSLRDPLERHHVRLTHDMYGYRIWYKEKELGAPLEVIERLVGRLGAELGREVPHVVDDVEAARFGTDELLVESMEGAGFIRRRDTVYKLAPGVLDEWHEQSEDAPSVEERLQPIQDHVEEALSRW